MCIRASQLLQVNPAGAIALHGQAGGHKINRGQLHHTGQRLGIRHLDAQAVKPKQRHRRCGRSGFAPRHHAHLVSPQQAADRHAVGGGLFKRHLQVGLEHGGLQAHRQAGGPVAQIRGQIEGLDGDAGVGLARLREGRALSAGVKAAAVQHKTQLRRDFHFALGIQIAQKWQAQIQFPQGVGFVHGFVRKVQRAIGQGDVVHGKLGPLAGGLGLVAGGAELGQNVVNVIAAFAQMREAHLRRIHGDGIDDGGQAQQGLQLGVYIDALDAQLVGTGVLGGDGEIAQGELQRPGFEVHPAQAYLAAQLLTGQFFHLAFDQGRHRHPCQRPQHRDPTHRPRQPTRPFVLHDLNCHSARVSPTRCKKESQKKRKPGRSALEAD